MLRLASSGGSVTVLCARPMTSHGCRPLWRCSSASLHLALFHFLMSEAVRWPAAVEVEMGIASVTLILRPLIRQCRHLFSMTVPRFIILLILDSVSPSCDPIPNPVVSRKVFLPA